jgi:hypothetical protein
VRRRSPQAVPLADAPRFRALARRTTLVRVGLGLGLVALLAGTLVAALGLREERTFLPPETSGVVVLDVSASISQENYRRIQASAAELAASDERYGLVVFSDVAYEALPPGTPADELNPLVRWFQTDPGHELGLLRNPWSGEFAGGTSISAGLREARRALQRDGVANGSVLLVSDLDDDPTDLPALRAEIEAYRRTGIQLRVLGLEPRTEDRALFARLVPDGFLAAASSAPAGLDEPRVIVSAQLSGALLAAGAALLLLLALNEHWCGRLSWGRRSRGGETR